ncbi:MAG: hypothetical protein ACTS6P_01235 [Candidatus Hodgkinia cicadicola]
MKYVITIAIGRPPLRRELSFERSADCLRNALKGGELRSIRLRAFRLINVLKFVNRMLTLTREGIRRLLECPLL